VVVGTASAVSGKVAANQAARPQAIGPGEPGGVPADDPASTTSTKLKKLGELRDAGILTDDEFQAKKTQLLGI
jgi:hypothetical protein